MDFVPVSKAAERLNVNVRTIQKWAKEGRIPGANKVGRDWMIPVTACRPGDIKKTPIEDLYAMLRVTSASFPLGKGLKVIDEIENADDRNIALGEYYYYSGEFEKSIQILEPYLDSENPAYCCTSALICAFANLTRDHTHMTDFSLAILQKKLNFGIEIEDEKEVVALIVFLFSIVAIQFHFDIKDIPPLDDYVRYLPEGLKLYACYLMAYKAYLEKDYSRSLGIADTAIACCREVYPIPMSYLHIIAAIDLMNLMKIEEAKARIDKAWVLVEKDNMIMPFVEHYGLLHGMIEVYFKITHRKTFDRIISVTKGYNSGWNRYHNKRTGRTVADNLTTTEFTVAMLFNRGWKIKAIADHMELSERTIKNYIQIIYVKLGINNKKELERYMLR